MSAARAAASANRIRPRLDAVEIKPANVRVVQMIDAGWVDEVGRIRREFPGADLQRLGHGYPELAAHLDGRLSLPQARDATIRQVRQYARRQLTWFRGDRRVQWFPTNLDMIVERLRVGMMTAEAS